MKAIRVLLVLVSSAIIMISETGCQSTGAFFNGVLITSESMEGDQILVNLNGSDRPDLNLAPGKIVKDPVCFAEVGTTRIYIFTAFKRMPGGAMKYIGTHSSRVYIDSYQGMMGSGYGGGNNVKHIRLTDRNWQGPALEAHGPDSYVY